MTKVPVVDAGRFNPGRDQGVCDACGGPCPVWFAENGLWNEVVGGPTTRDNPGSFLCSSCVGRWLDLWGKVSVLRYGPEIAACGPLVSTATTATKADNR